MVECLLLIAGQTFTWLFVFDQGWAIAIGSLIFIDNIISIYTNWRIKVKSHQLCFHLGLRSWFMLCHNPQKDELKQKLSERWLSGFWNFKTLWGFQFTMLRVNCDTFWRFQMHKNSTKEKKIRNANYSGDMIYDESQIHSETKFKNHPTC